MTGSSRDGTPPPGQSPRRPGQERGSTVSMTSTATGLPDRYRPLDQVGPDEPTATGVIRSWRAKDRVLNRDVAIRVHTPAGPAAHAWISRALTAGGLATPALAMVYDASEGIGAEPGDDTAGGGANGSAAYVVNEWIDGETLAERLVRGPMPEREVRVILRRLAEGVAEAHRVGLAVGGLSLDNVVLRPNGLVGLRAVPAATGTIDGDIAALGALLEACLTGLDPAVPEPRPLTGSSDLMALVRRARSTEAGQGLSSVAAMAALLGERPRSGSAPRSGPPGATAPVDTDSGWLRRLRDRKADSPAAAVAEGSVDGEAVRLDPNTLPPVPRVRPLTQADAPLSAAALGGDTIDAGTVAPSAGAYAGRRAAGPRTWDSDDHDGPLGMLGDRPVPDYDDGYDDLRPEDEEDGAKRHRLVVIGLPLLALALVIALAWWIGNALLSVSGDIDDPVGSTPSSSPSAGGSAGTAPAGAPATIVAAEVFDPQGDGDPDHPEDVPLAYDGDPTTAWSTYEYRGSPEFGNLKDGLGLLLDLGDAQELAGVTLTSIAPGATVEIYTGDTAATELDGFDRATDGTIKGETGLAFDEPVSARYVLVWITALVPSDGGFSADIAEIAVQPAG
jgi:eukaryotic-like serine/threonine-protein kinase